MITTTNPSTGTTTETDIEETSIAAVDQLVEEAHGVAAALEDLGRERRAALLESIAESLEGRKDALVRLAGEESGLSQARLNGELARSVFQFRLFAQALREGSYVEAIIDHAGDSPLGPAPDVRRMLRPIGPVAVFGASNFPFAFSVAGGDTASALAAGCPVVLKAHDSHPLTSLQSFEAIASALDAGGAPKGSVALVFGLEAGARLVQHPAIRAVSFTGSLSTGRVLLGLINQREEPIPFFGELSSLNPLIITPGAARARADEVAQGLFASVTGSAGQLCTKPGLAFVPSGADGDRLVDDLRELTSTAGGQVLLNQRIAESYSSISRDLVSHGAEVSARGDADGSGGGFVAAPMLLSVRAPELSAELTEECFGPLVVVVRYDDTRQLLDAFSVLPPSLTATIHCEASETDLAAELTRAVEPLVGRLVYNGYPTGVRVSWAQHHGGPWPATNSQHTSVGVTAMRRFLRPFAWQNAPTAVLPPELGDGTVDIPRRVDGTLVLPSPS